MEAQSNTNNPEEDIWEITVNYYEEPKNDSERFEIEPMGEILFENEKLKEGVYYDLFISNLEKAKSIADLKKDCKMTEELYLYFLGMKVPEIDLLEIFFPKVNCKIFIQREVEEKKENLEDVQK